MRKSNIFSLICLLLLSGSLIGQTFPSGTTFPVSVPDAASGASTCFGIPTAATATTTVTGLNGVVGAANELTVTFGLASAAASAGDYVVTLVSPNNISVNLVSRLGGCNNAATWTGSPSISIRNGGGAVPNNPATAVATTAYRPTSGITAGSGNVYPTSNTGMTAFQGVPRNGVWTLEVRDMKSNALTATITNFSLTFNKSASLDPSTVSSTLCVGSTYSFTATSVGMASGVFAAGTDFVVELSDAVGSFAAPTVIGQVLNTTSIDGPISVTIPGATMPSPDYDIRLRVLQSGTGALPGPITVNGSATIIGNTISVIVSGLPLSAITPSASINLGSNDEFCQTGSSNAATLTAPSGTGYTYSWTSSPVTAGGVGATTASFEIGNMAGTITHTVTITDPASTCVSSSSFTATRRDMPAPPTISTSGAACAGGVTLTANSPVGLAGTYSWSVNGGALVSPAFPSNVYSSAGAGSYTVLVNDANTTCSSLASTATVVNAPATLVLDPNNFHVSPLVSPNDSFTFCSNSGYSIGVSGGGPNAIYTWWDQNASGGPAVITTGPSYVPPITSLYRVTTTDANGCSTFIDAQVTVLIAPSPAPTVSTSSTCAGATLTSSSAPVNNTLQWYLGGVNTGSTGQNYTTSPTAPGIYNVRLVHPNSCYAESFPIVLSPTPATPTAAANGTCLGGVTPIMLTSSLAAVGQTYQWYMDGSVITGATNQTYSPTMPGNYTVSLTEGLCTSAISNSLPVYASPSVPAVTSSSTCVGGLLAGPSMGSLSFQWNLDGSPIGGATAQTYTTTAAGVVTLTVTNPISGCSATSTGITINAVASAPVISAPSSPACLTLGSSLTLSAATPAGPGQSFRWYLNGTQLPLATGQNYNAIVGGTYTAAIVQGACTSPVSNSIIVYTAPNVPTISSNSNCVGSLLTANASGATAYQWNLNGSAIGGATNSTYTAMTDGAYTVTVTNAAGCTRTSNNYTVIPSPSAPTIINPANSLPITTACLGTSGTALFTSGAMGTQTYQWFYFGSAITGANSDVYTATNAGDYTVSIVDGSCTSPQSAVVTVFAAPTTPTISSTSNCIGAALTSSASTNYQWFLDNNPISGGQTITATVAGSYTVQVINANGCSSPASSPKVIYPGSGTPAMVSSTGSFNFCTGDPYQLSSSVTATTYTWTVGASLLSTNPVFVPTTSGTYTLIIANQGGCSGSVSQAVTITQSPNPPTLAVSTSTLCGGAAITLTATPASGLTPAGYLYARNGVNLQSVITGSTFTATTSATAAAGTDVYTVRSEYIGNKSCLSVASAPINVTRLNPVTTFAPCPGSNLGASATLCKGSEIMATGVNAGTVAYTWYRGGTIVGTTNEITVNNPGNHRLVINQAGCVRSSVWTNISLTTGCTPSTCRFGNDKEDATDVIDFSFNELEMAAYPNPTSDMLNIDIMNSNASEGKIVLYNTLGQVVFEKNVILSEGKVSEQLDLSNVAAGIYSLSFQTAEGNKVQKVVKE